MNLTPRDEKKEILTFILLRKEILYPVLCLSAYHFYNELGRANLTFPIETKHLPFYQQDDVTLGMKLSKVIYLLILRF